MAGPTTVRYCADNGEVCRLIVPEGVIPPPGVLLLRDDHSEVFFNYDGRETRTDLLESVGGERNGESKAVRRYFESWHFPKEAE